MIRVEAFDPISSHLGMIASGIETTLILAVLTMALALVIGTLLAIATEFGAVPVRMLAIAYTELFRSCPLLLVLYIVFLVLPVVSGWTLSPFASGLIDLTLSVSAFVAEALRAGIVAVGPGLRQAALALGMTLPQLIRRIVWPLAWRETSPVLGSIWVGLFKDSSLVSLIQVPDLMFEGRVIANQTFQFMQVYSAVAAIYFLMAYPQAMLVDLVYRRMRTAQ